MSPSPPERTPDAPGRVRRSAAAVAGAALRRRAAPPLVALALALLPSLSGSAVAGPVKGPPG
ncbi:hypothetical protein SSCG_05080 [Streptomyces clavuligerus]|nr:hypothetical protein [Streptomyces clavuligerus]EDY52015.1 hypothetical protein SSCG_05080 [Streptomyces clavuligerus]